MIKQIVNARIVEQSRKVFRVPGVILAVSRLKKLQLPAPLLELRLTLALAIKCSISSTSSGTAFNRPMIFYYGDERSTFCMRCYLDSLDKYLQTGLIGK